MIRYLWIEDFDGDSNVKEYNKKNWEKYFQIENQTYIPEEVSLESVLQFLEEKENWKLFDAVLIDIRFKVCTHEREMENIYQRYFSQFLKKEKFDQYTEITNDDPSSASSGILLYLALIHRYNYSQNRIAFVSANVDGTGNKLNSLKKIKEYLYKAQYEDLTIEDIEDFSLKNEDLLNLLEDEGLINEKDFPIPKTENINWNETSKILDILKNMEGEWIFRLTNKEVTQLKYSSVREEFDKVGLIMSLAFEKPESETNDISWAFKYWKEHTLEIEYYELRSYIIPVCNLIRDLIDNNVEMSYKKVFHKSDKTTTDIKNMLSDIVELLPQNVWLENENSLCARIVRECVCLCDTIKKPEEGSLGEEKAAQSVLKITRNWMSHQGIRNIEAFDVAFVFYCLLTVFFKNDNNAVCRKYVKEAEQFVLSFYSNTNNELSKDCINDTIEVYRRVLREWHKESYNRFIERVGTKKAENLKYKYCYKEDASIYDRVSAIGNEYSDLRETVCMEYIYVLFLSMVDQDDALEKYLYDKLQKSDIFR